MSVRHDRQRQAGANHVTVHQHRAGAANSNAATLFGAGETDIVTYTVNQKAISRNFHLDFFTVDAKFDLLVHRWSFLKNRWRGVLSADWENSLGLSYRKKSAKLQAVFSLKISKS